MLTGADDPELAPWLYGIQEQRASGFLRDVSDAALSADMENYALIRPFLLLLKARYPLYHAKIEPPKD